MWFWLKYMKEMELVVRKDSLKRSGVLQRSLEHTLGTADLDNQGLKSLTLGPWSLTVSCLGHLPVKQISGGQYWELKSGFGCKWAQGKFESPLDSKIKPVNPQGNQPGTFTGRTWCWTWSSNTLATWCEEPTTWKRPRRWERLKAKVEGCDRGWDRQHHQFSGYEFEQTVEDNKG